MIFLVVPSIFAFVLIYFLVRLKVRVVIRAILFSSLIYLMIGLLAGLLLVLNGDRFMDGIFSWPAVLILTLLNQLSPIS